MGDGIGLLPLGFKFATNLDGSPPDIPTFVRKSPKNNKSAGLIAGILGGIGRLKQWLAVRVIFWPTFTDFC
jgi:hypothetical protein